ncbi:hypothetical protein FS837_009203 [Tulasnella sp. UAMH 9824]|nr:hypothetical protein FS837_009203 [Tulasnella sp. UAMH 9824]
MSYSQFEPKLTGIPKVPDEFGEDGRHFYRHYDALADELDENMVKSLKSQLDSILIFGGLFAGVNSAFLALTLPEMSADPADDTNAILLQLVIGGNSTIRSADHLPSATFTPGPGIVPINVLLSLSLTLAIIASFLAILGQQWLVYYRKRAGSGAEYQRWEQLQRAFELYENVGVAMALVQVSKPALGSQEGFVRVIAGLFDLTVVATFL